MLSPRAFGQARVTLQSHRLWLATFLVRPKSTDAPNMRRKSPRAANRQSGGNKHSPESHHPRTKAGLMAFQQEFKKANSLVSCGDVVIQSDLKAATRLFDRFLLDHKGTTSARDTKDLAQWLHQHLRNESTTARLSPMQNTEIVEFANKLVAAVKNGSLQPSRMANVHLLTLYGEAGSRKTGLRLWQWLRQQDDTEQLSLDVYGAAIELLAADGVPLSELEALYNEALQKFPGNFLEYHMSPNAIVPDRKRSIRVGGISNILLQSIMTARLYAGEHRDAYLALDTALRLFPVVVPMRFFSLYLGAVSLDEAFTVQSIAMRAGKSATFGRLFTKLQFKSTASLSMTERFLTVRQMLSLTYMYMGSAGELTERRLDAIITAITGLMRPAESSTASFDSADLQKLADATLNTVRKALEVFASFGLLPGVEAFGAIIRNVAGPARDRSILNMTLRDVKSLDIPIKPSLQQAVLAAAGSMRDRNFVAESWKALVQAHVDVGHLPTAFDLRVLIRAARLSGCPEYARDVAEKAMGYLPQSSHQGIHDLLDGDGEVIEGLPINVSEFVDEMAKLRSDLAFIEARAKAPGGLTDFSDVVLPMTMTHPSEEFTMPEPELRRLYDELTTEQQSAVTSTEEATVTPNAAEQASVAETTSDIEYSSTNVRFDDLRYENWKTINYLLALSEKNENAYRECVDQAIVQGLEPPKRSEWVKPKEAVVTFGLSDIAAIRAQAQKPMDDEAKIQQARMEILRLRGLLPAGIEGS